MTDQQIYIKTEPGGKIVFGKLSNDKIKLLLNAIKEKKMPKTLLDLRNSYNSNFKVL